MLVLGCLVCAYADKGNSDMKRAKARHFFLSAVKNDAEGNTDMAAELYKRAYEIDSTYAEAALEYGLRRWGMPADTLATKSEKERSRKIAGKFFEQYPGDIFPNVLYTNVIQQGGNFDEAIRVLESLHNMNPDNADMLKMLSDAYLDAHYFDKALEAIERYERAEGESLELMIRKAGMRLAMEDTVGALAEADRMITKNPSNQQYLLFKSQLQQFMNQNDSALATAMKADKLSKPGYGGPVKAQMADIYLSMGDSVNYDKSTYETLLAEDLSFDVKNSILATYLQNLIIEDGNRERGDKLFAVLLKQYPHEPELLSLAARYSASKEDYAKASEAIEYALDLDHRNSEYWEQAMIYAVMQNEPEKVESVFEAAKKNLHNLPMRIYLIAGAEATASGKPERGVNLYSECIEKNFPGLKLNEPVDMQILGRYLTMDNLPEVINLYQQAGDAYYNLNNRENAFLNYENSLSIDPDNPLTLNNYAYFLIETVKDAPKEVLDKADDMSKRAITLAPDNATYLDTRAWVLFRKGEYKEAKEMQMRAIEVASKDGEMPDSEAAEFYSHLGDILFMNGEPEAALQAWEKAVKGDPENKLLQKKIKHKTFFYE